MTKNMKRSNQLITAVLVVWLLPCAAYAQYIDHRTYYHELDSLEQELAVNSPAGWDLAVIYNRLAWGYRNINSIKSMDYARKGLAVA